MLFTIAWRNVWRQKVRSLVIIGAMVVGLWGLIFAIGFMSGFMDSYLSNALKYEYSHIQVHHPDFKQDQEIKYNIKQGIKKVAEIVTDTNVKAATHRTIVNAMIGSAKASSGVKVLGVDSLLEKEVTSFDQLITDGTYFKSVKRNPLLIGEKLAEKLKVKLRSKIVLTFQNLEGEIVSEAFRVAGIFNAKSPILNETVVMVNFRDINKNLGDKNLVSEIAVYLNDVDKIEESQEAISSILPDYRVEKWDKLAPELSLIVQQSKTNVFILVTIFMTALIFGIINTMLMAVLERIKELGMLMAIGMNRIKVFTMIIIETIFLGLVACPVGLFLGHLTISYFNGNGFDLSDYSQGLEKFGYETVIYPIISGNHYFMLSMGIFITTIVASIYPALKAIKLKPAEALRKI
ncbi:FtsX-like permease family protein [Fulvivirgaceae bacterium BMA12]|uniref:FtsX-like permease family protein n=1 Tax=Agaribacillus aureus TaxID=3051825 RepID=A0ABT8LBW2_9BACT|nr:FtsX-like permease family protein [Fulvivirgaceae bacterium BMA12]